MNPLVVSLLVASVATVLCVLVGLPIAIWLDGVGRGRWIFETLISLPLVLPPTVVGWVLMDILGKQGLSGQWILAITGKSWLFTWQAIALASFLIGLPLFVRAVCGSLARIEPELWETARLCGATDREYWWWIGLPLATSGMVAGAGLAFGRSLGEFGAALILGGQIPGSTETVATALWTAIETGDQTAATRWATLLALGALTIHLGTIRWTGGRSRGRAR